MEDDKKQLDQYGRNYPPKRGEYYTPALTTDAIAIQKKDNQIYVVLIERDREPMKGKLAFPGGYIEYNESPEDCVIRELNEETNLEGKNPTLFEVRGQPLRDSTKHSVSIIYEVQVDDFSALKGGDDAKSAKLYFIDDLIKQKEQIAFDHYDILKSYCKKIFDKDI